VDVWRALAAVGIILGVAGVARADAGSAVPFDLTWEAPAGCPDASFVRRRVEQIVRGPPLDHTVVVAKAKVEVMADQRLQLVLTLRTGDVEETKTVAAPSCSALAQATATIIALAIETSADSGDAKPAAVPPPPPPPPPRAEPERKPVTPAPVPAAPVALPPGPSPHPRDFAPGAFVSIERGTLPESSVAFGVSAALRLQRFRVGVLGSIALQQSSSFSRTAGASFDMMQAGGWGAYVVPLGSVVGVGPSASVEATRVHARAFGIREPKERSAVWPTLAFGGRLEAKIARPIRLFARAEVLFPVGAPQFSLATVEEPLRLHQPSTPSLRLSLGVEIVIPGSFP
jgi:hypothetical protein